MPPQTTHDAPAGMFEPVKLGPLTLANRFVRSAIWEGLAAQDGTVTQKLTGTLVGLAGEGGYCLTAKMRKEKAANA